MREKCVVHWWRWVPLTSIISSSTWQTILFQLLVGVSKPESIAIVALELASWACMLLLLSFSMLPFLFWLLDPCWPLSRDSSGCKRLYRIAAWLKFCSCSSLCFCAVWLMSRLVAVFGFVGSWFTLSCMLWKLGVQLYYAGVWFFVGWLSVVCCTFGICNLYWTLVELEF